MNARMTATPLDQNEVPPELSAKPLALIGIAGLDTLNNATHKLIWEAFSNNRRIERSPVTFKLISNSHEFPVIKPKRNSYEWYIPKGILKRNWMNKHLNEIPAVISVFYDLDWNDSQWNEKMIECASRVQSIRAAIEGRNIKIVVVLVQDIPPLPVGEDALATERGVTLCASCELNAKSLFVLPHGDHLQGYVVRLENAFYELAKNYYYVESRTIKSHRDYLNKNTHQYLFVRHQFKMGFLNELRQDNHTAYKHYTHAYNNLMEIRIVDTNAMEIRTAASFINYKLCRLMFNLGLPRDAISQFRAHTDGFKSRIGFTELTYEHHAWMSLQFSLFGDIFDEAVKLGLPAVQTQHPGVYYQQAAQYAVLRKTSSQELCNSVTEYPSPDPLENIKQMEFYGQRPWRPGKLNAEPPDPQLESKGIQALQFLEKQVNHSSIIISLYGLAISQYKTYKCVRTRRFLIVQMADEYYNSQDYGKALTLYMHMLWDYRTEHWWLLVTDILNKALNCAFLTANIQDFVIISLELLGPSPTISKDEKRKIFQNLQNVLKKKLPEFDCTVKLKPNTWELWKQALGVPKLNFTLDMCNIVSCIDSKGRFMQDKYQADQQVAIELLIRSTCLFPLMFTNISVTINTPEDSSEYFVAKLGNNKQQLLLKCNEVKKFVIEFTPNPSDVGKELQIGSINLHIGDEDKNCSVDLKYNGLGSESNKICPDLVHFRRNGKIISEFDTMKTLGTSTIVPRQSKLTVKFEHFQPALLNERYGITISIVNDEKHMVENLQIEAMLLNEEEAQTTEVCLNGSTKFKKFPLKLSKGNLKPLEAISQKIRIRCNSVESRNISVKITYLLKSKKAIASIKEDVLYIPVVRPFEFSTLFTSLQFGEITKFYVGEPFMVMPIVTCQSPWPIVIQKCSLKYSDLVEPTSKDKSELDGVTLCNGNVARDIYIVEALKQRDNLLKVGQYTVKWKRENGQETESEFSILGLSVDWTPLAVNLPLPEYGLVRTPLLITYEFYNRSHQLIQLEMNMEGSEAFMFAGYRQIQISILPESTKRFHYNLYPLIAGNVKLPKLTLAVPEGSTEGPALRQEQLNSLLDRAIPAYIFIMPQSRGLSKSSEKSLVGKVSATVA